MDLRELKIQFLHAKVVTDDIKVMFRTPDCYTYYVCNSHIANYNDDNVLIIDLVDKIKPIFNSGDKVTNKMFPENGYTIKEVNEEEQYYSYKEINGKTYFKDQDKLKLVNTDNCKPPVEDDIMLVLDINVVKNIQARAIANKAGIDIIKNILNDIKTASAEGKGAIKIEYDKYSITYDNKKYVIDWARICGFNVASYSDCIIINW